MNAEASPGALSRRVDELTVVERGVKCRPIRGKLILLFMLHHISVACLAHLQRGRCREVVSD